MQTGQRAALLTAMLDFFSSYYTSWFENYCGTVPPMNEDNFNPTSIPTVVPLSFATVHIVNHTGKVTQPTYTNTPLYQGTGSLLDGACLSTEFTLLDVGSTVFYAPFVGCVSDRPDCCPYTVATTTLSVTQDTTVTMTITASGASDQGQGQSIMAYPQPADQQIMQACASDYYSISGNCCPKSYFPFTRALAGATPCYSSLTEMAAVPTLTAGLAGEPTDTSRPTSAVVNVVWAMSYPVQNSSSNLSTGAIAGISIGAVGAIAAISGLSFWLWRVKRRNRKLEAAAPPAGGPSPMIQQQQAVPQGFDTRGSIMTSAPSLLSPQQTGTPSVSELSSVTSNQPLLNGQNGYFAGARTPSLASSPSPGPGGIPGGIHGPIAEADEGIPAGGHPWPGQQPPHFSPQPGMAPMPQQPGATYPQYAMPPGQPMPMPMGPPPLGHPMPMPMGPPPPGQPMPMPMGGQPMSMPMGPPPPGHPMPMPMGPPPPGQMMMMQGPPRMYPQPGTPVQQPLGMYHQQSPPANFPQQGMMPSATPPPGGYAVAPPAQELSPPHSELAGN